MRYLKKIQWKNAVFSSAPRKWVPLGLDPYLLQSDSAARTVCASNVFRSNHICALWPTYLVQVNVHCLVVTTTVVPAIIYLGEGHGTYCPKTHNQYEPKNIGAHRSHPDPLSGHLPGLQSLRRPNVLTLRPF